MINAVQLLMDIIDIGFSLSTYLCQAAHVRAIPLSYVTLSWYPVKGLIGFGNIDIFVTLGSS